MIRGKCIHHGMKSNLPDMTEEIAISCLAICLGTTYVEGTIWLWLRWLQSVVFLWCNSGGVAYGSRLGLQGIYWCQGVTEGCSGWLLSPQGWTARVAHQGALSHPPIAINLATPTPRAGRVASYGSYVMRGWGNRSVPSGIEPVWCPCSI